MRRALARIRARWGEPPVEQRDVELAAKLLEVTELHDNAYEIDAHTWSDLDMDQVFAAIDHSQTPLGTQSLYRSLRRPDLSQDRLDARERAIAAMADNVGVREDVQRALTRLEGKGAWYLPDLLWRELPPSRVPVALFHLLAFSLLATIVLALIAAPWLWFVAAIIFTANTVIHFQYEHRITRYLMPLGALGRLITASRRISRAIAPSHNASQLGIKT